MDFSFTSDQLAFRDAVRDLLRDQCPASAVRAAWADGGPGFDPKLWAQLREMGVLEMLAPEALGGLGCDELDLVLILEEAGRAAMPGPIVEHAAVAVPALAAAGMSLLGLPPSDDQLVIFGDGSGRLGWARLGPAVMVDGDGLRLVASGDLTSVADVESVDRSRRDATVTYSGGEPLAAGDATLALDRAALGAAAQLCGLAAALIDTTVAYSCARHQFGVPIGSYQALKHHMANALLLLEHARPAVYRAAYSVAHAAPTRSRDVSMAKVMAGRAGSVAARAALQCHGAIGYTWEHDLHLWLKRVWVLERAWGSTDFHRDRVADAILGPAGR